MATDALSDLLKTVRLTGAAYFEIAAQAPWSVRSPAREMILPRILPGADHLIAYHVVTAGRCFSGPGGGGPGVLEGGGGGFFFQIRPPLGLGGGGGGGGGPGGPPV